MLRAMSLSSILIFSAATAAGVVNRRARARRSISFARRLRVLLGMSIAIGTLTAPVVAADRAWEDCAQKADRDRSIRGCSRFLARGDAESASKRAAAYNNRGSAYLFQKDDYDHAIADLDEVIRLNPKHADSYIGRAVAYGKKSNYDRAIVDLNEAIRLDLKSANAIAYFDRVLQLFSEIASERDHDEEIRRNPTQFAIYIFRGLAYLKKKNFNYAIADFSQAILRNSKLVPAYFFRASAHLGNDDPIRARADLETALALDPRNQLVKELLLEVLPAKAPVVTPTPTIVSPSASAPAPQQSSTSYSCAGSRRVALVVGNAAYPGAALLANPANDAEDVADLLQQKLYFRVILAKDATFAAFSQKIGEFAEAAEGAEVALFYYAGHGMQFQQTNYLLPIDSRLANEYEAMHNNVSAQDVVTMLESRAKFTLVLLDACRNNPIEEDFRRRMSVASRDYGAARGLAPMTTRGGETLVVFATRPNERAADGSGRNSPFTRAFLEHIATPGKDVELVLRDVTARVRELTGGRQASQRLTELQHGLILLPAR